MMILRLLIASQYRFTTFQSRSSLQEVVYNEWSNRKSKNYWKTLKGMEKIHPLKVDGIVSPDQGFTGLTF